MDNNQIEIYVKEIEQNEDFPNLIDYSIVILGYPEIYMSTDTMIGYNFHKHKDFKDLLGVALNVFLSNRGIVDHELATYLVNDNYYTFAMSFDNTIGIYGVYRENKIDAEIFIAHNDLAKDFIIRSENFRETILN